MATLTHSTLGIWDRIEASVWRRRASLDRRPAADRPAESARARRDFIHEVLTRNPDAFSSDLDVQSLMQHYPGEF